MQYVKILHIAFMCLYATCKRNWCWSLPNNMFCAAALVSLRSVHRYPWHYFCWEGLFCCRHGGWLFQYIPHHPNLQDYEARDVQVQGPQGCVAALHGRDVEVVVPWLEAAVLRTGILNMAPMMAMMNDSCVRQEMIDELKLTHLRQVRFTTSTCLVK